MAIVTLLEGWEKLSLTMVEQEVAKDIDVAMVLDASSRMDNFLAGKILA